MERSHRWLTTWADVSRLRGIDIVRALGFVYIEHLRGKRSRSERELGPEVRFTSGADLDRWIRVHEDQFPHTRGWLPQNYGELSSSHFDDLQQRIRTACAEASPQEVFDGLLDDWAEIQGTRGGEWFTPRPIRRLLVEVINPHTGL